MTRTTPELAPPSPNFRATAKGGRLATTNDIGVYSGTPGWVGFRTLTTEPNPNRGTRIGPLACSRPHTRRIFSGIGFRITATLLSGGRELTTRPPRPF
ncbi:hypothetical protein AVEN_85985-1 [Araneus ventricosus]|uniref:Uncharacterized protein n=1 Tax=Araneus ventricosus TaxID=182803 RepID=A0A4Y2PSE6_ARAVE|nr:hypothetical protein AVEN_85985-1 [Araneus ventricosus]